MGFGRTCTARIATLPALDSSVANTPAIDFQCPKCVATYQLKAQSSAFSRRIVDAAYSTMVRAIMENRTPNLFAMHYGVSDWVVENVILIPHFAFPLSAIEKTKAAGRNSSSRRLGRMQHPAALNSVDARITIISDGKLVAPAAVRAQYARIRPLAKLDAKQRGWTLDVLNIVRSLGKPTFNLAEIYRSEDKLAHLHPANRHVRDKIRQQLQVLRDLGILEFLRPGEYHIR